MEVMTQKQRRQRSMACKRYREAHPDKVRASRRHWREANLGKEKASARRRYKADPGKQKARARRWYEANRNKARIRVRCWRDANPERVRAASHRASGKRRAHVAEVMIGSVDREAIFKADGYRCVYCGSTRNLSLDHIVSLAKGGSHTEDNLVVACRYCNSSKGTKILIVWFAQSWLGERGICP